MIRLLIIGTGGMAHAHARAFQEIDGVELVAGVDTSTERLEAFQKEFNIPNGFASVEAALEWGAFDAATNVTPDGVHYATTMPLLAAGKHVLCEKPLAQNYDHASQMAEAAEKAGVITMVNLTYRNVAAIQKAREIVEAGDIGEIRHFEASYLQSWLTQPAWGDWKTESQWLWRLSEAHGSKGVLGDVGVHILDFATYAAGLPVSEVAATLPVFHKAEGDKIGEYTLDANDSAVMNIRLGDKAAGVVHASRFATGHLNDLKLRLYGTKGGLEVSNEYGHGVLRVCSGGAIESAAWHTVQTPSVLTNYEKFIRAIKGQEWLANPNFKRGAELQRWLDAAVVSDENGGGRISV